MRLFAFLLLSLISVQGSFLAAASNSQEIMVSADSLLLPSVFIIGEHEEAFNELGVQYEVLLLTACEDNMDIAYDKWLNMLEELEAFSIVNDFDLKGIKMWLNVFWNSDGSISHIAYHLKPQSRNVDTRFLTAIFSEFVKVYRFPLVYEEKYSHYGTASFPVFPRRLGGGVKVNSGSLQNMSTDGLVKDKN